MSNERPFTTTGDSVEAEPITVIPVEPENKPKEPTKDKEE